MFKSAFFAAAVVAMSLYGGAAQAGSELICKHYASAKASQTESASCASSSYVMTGGGCQTSGGGSGDQDLLNSYPKDDDTWICSTSDSSRQVTAYALCCQVVKN